MQKREENKKEITKTRCHFLKLSSSYIFQVSQKSQTLLCRGRVQQNTEIHYWQSRGLSSNLNKFKEWVMTFFSSNNKTPIGCFCTSTQVVTSYFFFSLKFLASFFFSIIDHLYVDLSALLSFQNGKWYLLSATCIL